MRLLATGLLGFIGSAFLRRALAEPSVTAVLNIDCLTYAGSEENVAEVADDPRYRWSMTDIRNRKAVNALVESFKPTHIVHLAAASHVDRSIDDPHTFIATNVIGTYYLLEAAKVAVGLELFLHISTDEVFGSLGINDTRFTEDSPYRPNSPYSASKASSDHLVRSYHKTYALPAIITHSSNNYGPRQHQEKLIPTIIRSCLQGKPIPIYGDGMNKRDWIHVEDNCDALWAVLVRGKSGETYNIGADEEWSNVNIADFVSRACGKKLDIAFVEDRKGHDWRYSVDNSKIMNQLSWRPQWALADGLKATVDWYSKRL